MKTTSMILAAALFASTASKAFAELPLDAVYEKSCGNYNCEIKVERPLASAGTAIRFTVSLCEFSAKLSDENGALVGKVVPGAGSPHNLDGLKVSVLQLGTRGILMQTDYSGCDVHTDGTGYRQRQPFINPKSTPPAKSP